MAELKDMSVRVLIVLTKQDPPDMLGPMSLSVIAELDRRLRIPPEGCVNPIDTRAHAVLDRIRDMGWAHIVEQAEKHVDQQASTQPPEKESR